MGRDSTPRSVVGTLIASSKSNTTASPVVLTPRNRRRHISHAMPLMASLASASPGPAGPGSQGIIAGSPAIADSGCETVTHAERVARTAPERRREARPGRVSRFGLCSRGVCAPSCYKLGVSRGIAPIGQARFKARFYFGLSSHIRQLSRCLEVSPARLSVDRCAIHLVVFL